MLVTGGKREPALGLNTRPAGFIMRSDTERKTKPPAH